MTPGWRICQIPPGRSIPSLPAVIPQRGTSESILLVVMTTVDALSILRAIFSHEVQIGQCDLPQLRKRTKPVTCVTHSYVTTQERCRRRSRDSQGSGPRSTRILSRAEQIGATPGQV